MGVFQIIKLVCQLLIEFGPGLFKLGKQVYDMVEEWSRNRSAVPTSGEKAIRFNDTLVELAGVRRKALTPARITLLREGVWALNNRKKTGG